MPGPVQFDPLQPSIGAVGRSVSTGSAPGAKAADGSPSFKDVLLQSLDQVNRLQQEASQGVERLATGQTDNVAEVLTAVKKAGIAFDLLMEIRNKLMDAYREVQQMHV
jgi:flagellar hook-basal body complex protein FliE